MIMITLDKIRAASPCTWGWKMVRGFHAHRGMNTEFPLSLVVNSNGIEDTLWCVGNVINNSKICIDFVNACASRFPDDNQLARYANEAYIAHIDTACVKNFRKEEFYVLAIQASNRAIYAALIRGSDDYQSAYECETQWQEKTLKNMLDE